jgi:hypothetical protein
MKCYQLTFPSGLTEERVRAFLRSISGTLKSSWLGFFNTPTIVFETWADDRGIIHRLLVPPGDAAFIISHLETMVPGVRVTQDTERPLMQWDQVTEVGMSNPSRQLAISDGTDFAHSILTSVQALDGDQTVLMQWVIAPKAPERPPASDQRPRSNEMRIRSSLAGRIEASHDEITDRRAKLETPNYMSVGRVAIKCAPEQVDRLNRDVLLTLSATSSGANRFTRKTSTKAKFIEAVNTASAPLLFPAQVSVMELSALIAWPLGTPYIAGLPKSHTRHMHVTNAVSNGSNGGTVIGQSTVPGKERLIAIDRIDRMKHVHIMGPIGSGKTALATNMIEGDFRDGFGVVLIETKGDLFESALERVPEHRLKDVIVWDLSDTSYPIGFNVLEQSSSRSAVDELNALLASMYPEGGVITPQVMYHGLHALAEVDGGTMIDLPTILSPQTDEERAWRDGLVASIKNRDIRKFWERYLKADPKSQDRESAPLHRRLWQFSTRPEVRNSLGQSKSTFKMDDVVREGKILLVNLNGVRIGTQTASMVGTLIMNSLWNSVRTTKHEKPVILYMDEFQNFVTMPTSPADMLAQSRSFGLGMVLAHQHTGQLKPELREAVLANARTKIVFQTTQTDARLMASEFGTLVTAEDFMNLQSREAIARVSTSSGVSQPFTMRTRDLSRPSSSTTAIRKMSRAMYGRPIDQVDTEIETRRTAKPVEPTSSMRKPTVGVREWTD